MLRFALLTSLLALAACKVEIAPAGDDYVLDLEVQGRTDLGTLTTFTADGLLGATSIGHHVSVRQPPFGTPWITWTETTDTGPCERRIRSFGVPYNGEALDAGDAYVEECSTPGDPRFGHDLLADDYVKISASDVMDGPDILRDPAFEGSLSSADRTLSGGSNGERSLVAVGLPSENRVALAAELRPEEGWEWDTPPMAFVDKPVWLSDTAGFGAKVWMMEDLLVVGDALGGFHFYEVDAARDLVTATPTQGPAFDVLHATHGSDLLVERGGMWDLEVLRYTGDGQWETVDTLVNAAGGYSQWVMDEVAAFAVVPREGRRRGAVDRWSRGTGHLDASLSLVRPHDGVDLALDGETLVVSERGALGAVHVFDWTEARTRLFGALGGVFDDICVVAEGRMDAPTLVREGSHDADGDERFQFVADAGDSSWGGPDERVAYALDVPAQHLVTLSIRNPLDPDELPPEVQLVVDGEPLNMPYVSESDMVDGTVSYSWYNHASGRYDKQRLDIVLDGEDQDYRTCRAFELTIDLTEEWSYCQDGWDYYDSIDLLSHSGDDRTLNAEKPEDRYDIEVIEGQTLLVQRDGDVDVRLLDANGEVVETYYSSSWSDEHGLEYTFDADDLQPFSLVVDRRGWFGNYEPTHSSCTPYILHASIDQPSNEEQP